MKRIQSRLLPYWQLMRFDKPIGIFLLLWPTLWGLLVASNGQLPLRITLLFTAGVIIMRAAGCVINDIADHDIDTHVARTAHRPLARGSVSRKQALMLFGLLLSIAFSIVLQLNSMTIALAVIAASLTILYPFTKRFFTSPQLVLGLAFAWGIPMAFSAIQEALPLKCWWLFSIALLWPIAYDTQYALADIEDDKQLPIYSTALWLGEYVLAFVVALQMTILVLLFGFGCLIDASGLYYGSLMSVSYTHLTLPTIYSV